MCTYWLRIQIFFSHLALPRDLIIFPFPSYCPARATVEKHHMGVFFRPGFSKEAHAGLNRSRRWKEELTGGITKIVAVKKNWCIIAELQLTLGEARPNSGLNMHQKTVLHTAETSNIKSITLSEYCVNNNYNNLLIYSALFNIPSDQKRINC